MWELAVDLSDVRGASHPSVAVRLFGPFRVVRSGAAPTLARVAQSAGAHRLSRHGAASCPSRQAVRDVLGRPQRSSRRAALVPLQNPRAARRPVPRAREGRKRLGVHRCVDHRGRRAVGRCARRGGDFRRRPRSPQAAGGEVRGRVPRGFRGGSHSPVRSLAYRGASKIPGFHADVLSRIIALLPKTGEALPYIRKRLDLLPYDVAAHRDLLATLAACGRFAEGEAHLEAATHLFRSQGLSSAPLDKAWREHRQLAARGTRPESPPLSVAPPAATETKSGHPKEPAFHAERRRPRHHTSQSSQQCRHERLRRSQWPRSGSSGSWRPLN